MTRGLRGLVAGLTAGLTVAGVVTGVLAGGGAAAAGVAPAVAPSSAPSTGSTDSDGSGPVATPPSAPAVQTVTGAAANGVQVSMTAPKQLPVDLPGQRLPGREVDVTVKDVAGQGYTGSADLTLTAEGAGVSRLSLRVERYDADAASWTTLSVPTDSGASWTTSVPVTVPAAGTQEVRLRLSPGTTAVDDVKVSAAVNGATAVATVPVTEPTFQAGGLTAAVRAGAPENITGKLSNPTDVDYEHVPVKLFLKACPPAPGKCFGPADVKLEAQIGGAWQPVQAATDPTAGAGGMSATIFPDLTLTHGDTVQLTARMTLNTGATQVNPVQVGFGPIGLTFAGQQATGGTLTVQPLPTPTPTPTSTSTSSAPTSTPSPTDTASSATDTPTDTTSSTAPATPSTGETTAPVAASTPGASSSSSPTILVAAGLFAFCLALVLVWALMRRRERERAAVRVESGDPSELREPTEPHLH